MRSTNKFTVSAIDDVATIERIQRVANTTYPGMTRWKGLPRKCSGLPEEPTPRSPVTSARKFSAVFGTTSALSVISMRPRGAPSAVTYKHRAARESL